MISKHIIFFIASLCVLSCQPKDKFDWNAGISAPKNYPSGAPFVEYFYKGKSIAGNSSGTGADQGWGITSGGVVGGNKFKEVPDSVSVKWVCSVDNLLYKGGAKLPRNKMLELFNKKNIDSYGDRKEYTVITAGMAPGGNVAIWMQGGNASTEVKKFKVKGEEDPNIDADYKKKDIKSWGNYLTYWKLHGIPYSVWEQGEKEYNYDIGFIDKSKQINPSITTIITKDGSLFQYFKQPSSEFSIDNLTDSANLNIPNNNSTKNKKLPVQMELSWKKNNSKNYYYRSIIVLPKDFEQRFDRKENRVLIETLNDNFGEIYLINSKGKQKIMKFKFDEYNDTDHRVFYSLPKDFVFPKWEGREPLKFPELDSWQEK